MQKLKGYFAPFYQNIVAAILAMIVSAAAELGLPFLLAEIIDQGLVQQNQQKVLYLGGWMLLCALLAMAGTLINGFLAAKVAAGMSRSLRMAVFSHITALSLPDIEKFGTASLITRSTNDITQLQNYTMAVLRMVIRAPIIAVGGLFLALYKSPKLALVLFVSLPTLFFIVTVIASKGMPLSMQMQQRLDDLTLVLREKLTGVRVIRAFRNEQYEQERFAAASERLFQVTVSLQRNMALLFPAAGLMMGITIAMLVWFGSGQVMAGAATVGDVMALIQYVIQVNMAMMMLSMAFVMLPRARTSAERIVAVLETMPSIVEIASEQPSDTEQSPLVSVKQLSFRYPNAEEDALQGIDFTVSAGEMVAVVGGTGSGKSTLLRMLLRFYDPTQGEILLNGTPIWQLPTAVLRQKLGYVSQKPMIFSGSIAENLRMGKPDATDEQLYAAMAVAQAAELTQREGGLEAPMEQRGTNLSGGQKQRLSIARAVLRAPMLYLLDDSFSALDYATDAALRRALRRTQGDAALLVVAQRISTIQAADRILVLDAGRQVGLGTHAALLASCPVYQELVRSQGGGMTDESSK